MNMTHPEKHPDDRTPLQQHGFSLLEVILVVAITLVLTAMTARSMGGAIGNYRLNTTSRNLTALAQLAKVKATARDTRYRISTSGSTYQLDRFDRTTSTWVMESNTAAYNLAPGVTFSTTGITTAPPIESPTPAVTQATNMTFNTRGLLIDDATGAAVNSRCFYLRGVPRYPNAVCSSLAGRSVVYRYDGGNWIVQ